MSQTPGKIVAACIGDCVHVAGVTRFLNIAQDQGYETYFTGPATDLETLLDALVQQQPQIVGLSYRLTPENARTLFTELRAMLDAAGLLGRVRVLLGATPPVAEVAREFDYIEQVFAGEESPHEIRAVLRGEPLDATRAEDFPQQAIERIRWKAPSPILRHHFGIPAQSIAPTLEGIARIAEARVIDVISLGADQDAQENFFRPWQQDPRSKGAGGVPFRTREDLIALYEASRCGNYPLLRSYSGTSDHLRYAELLHETIHNAWCATSLFWFNAMDGRGPSPLVQSIAEHQELMAWHGERGIPVEGNETYHWGMRDAPDSVVCASGLIYAHNAKKFGVRDYILTYMFQSPPHLNNRMDLARCLAILELSEALADEQFRVWRQVRTGLLSHPVNMTRARAHLAQSTMLQMAVQPQIIHIVGHTEAHHAASAEDVIEAALIVQEVVDTALRGSPDMTQDRLVQRRKAELIAETQQLIAAIRALSPDVEDPLSDPATLAQAVALGLLDAPQLVSNHYAPGQVRTRSIDGAMRAIDARGQPLSEAQRLHGLHSATR